MRPQLRRGPKLGGGGEAPDRDSEGRGVGGPRSPASTTSLERLWGPHTRAIAVNLGLEGEALLVFLFNENLMTLILLQTGGARVWSVIPMGEVCPWPALSNIWVAKDSDYKELGLQG